MKKKKRLSFYILIACVAVFGSLGLLLLVRGEKEARPSEAENRMLAGFPDFSLQAVADGSFMEGMESYLSDAMPARNSIIVQTASWMKALSLDRSESTEEDVYEQIAAFGRDEEKSNEEETPVPVSVEDEPVTVNVDITLPEQQEETRTAIPVEITPEPTEEPEATQTPAPAQTPESTPEPEKQEKPSIPIRACTFQQYRKDGTSRQVYQFPKENVANAVKVLNAYRKALPESGHVFFSQVPFPETALALSEKKYVGWGSDLEEVLSANTSDGVVVVSTLEVLEEPLLNGEDLYFLTDHHWKPRAASYVAQTMLERIGITPLNYDEYSYQHLGGFYGSHATSNPEIKKKVKADTIDVLIPNLPVKSYVIAWNQKETKGSFMVLDRHTYSAYLGGTQGPWRRYETGVDCGRKCLVIGDSYICCFVPFLAPYYEEIHTTDMRPSYFDAAHKKWSVSEYLKRNEIDDVYIILSTSSGVNSDYMLSYLMKYL